MARYMNRIEVRDPNALTNEIADFLSGKGYKLGVYNGETVWHRNGFNCEQMIIIRYEPNAVILTAFISFFDALLGQTEMGITGFVALAGKRPLKKVVKALEELIKAKGA